MELWQQIAAANELYIILRIEGSTVDEARLQTLMGATYPAATVSDWGLALNYAEGVFNAARRFEAGQDPGTLPPALGRDTGRQTIRAKVSWRNAEGRAQSYFVDVDCEDVVKRKGLSSRVVTAMLSSKLGEYKGNEDDWRETGRDVRESGDIYYFALERCYDK